MSTMWPIRTDHFPEQYEVEKQIGRGKFAVVRLVRCRSTSAVFAAKFLRKRRKGSDCRADLMHEVAMLELVLGQPRFIQLREVFESAHEIILVMDYVPGGEVYRWLQDEEALPEEQVQRLVAHILEALNFLHTQNIVHLDIKTENLLLTAAPPDGDVVLCDFGFARKVSKTEDILDIIGTLDYVAPEVLAYERIETATDLWSVGVVAYVLLTGCSPFGGGDKQTTFLNISQINLEFPGDLFDQVSPLAIDFISRLLVRNPNDRLTASSCLGHPWLAGVLSTPLSGVALSAPSSAHGSPAGSRRALAAEEATRSPDQEPKRCRSDTTSPPLPSTSTMTPSLAPLTGRISTTSPTSAESKINSKARSASFSMHSDVGQLNFDDPALRSNPKPTTTDVARTHSFCAAAGSTKPRLSPRPSLPKSRSPLPPHPKLVKPPKS